jgi:DNA repair exonuclease SbcCD ATPase subunit
MAITIKDIWAVADALDAEGIKPTLQAVRKKLGGGSFSTISDAMTEWKAKKAAATGKPKEPLPTALVERLGEVGAELWTMAMDASHARLEDERRALAEKHAEMEARLTEAVELADTLTQEVETLRGQLTELADAKRQCEKVTEQLSDQKRRSGEELNRAMQKVQTAEATAMEDRKAAREATERAAKLEGQVEAYRTQLGELSAAVKALGGRPGARS